MAESDTAVLPDDEIISGSLNGEEAAPERPDPAQAVEDARRQVDQERAGRVAAEARAVDAENRARTTVASAQETTLEAQINGYDSKVNEARAARRAARDAGDQDAEEAADVAIQDALADKKLAVRERDWVKQKREAEANEPPRDRQRIQLTAPAQKWVDDHPRFTTDQEYHAEAIAADMAWRARGRAVDTPEYFAFVESRLAREFPDAATPNNPRPAVTQTRRPASSTAASPARGGDGGASRTTQLTEGDIARALGVEVADLKQAAAWNDMKYDAYLKDQAEIIAAKRDGRPTGLFGGGDGATYR